MILTDRLEGTEGAARRARELAASRAGPLLLRRPVQQPGQPAAHRETTGPEIWAQTDGRITHFVAAMGTTGTMMGTGGYLKEKNAGDRLVGVQPDSPFHGLEGLKHLATTQQLPALYDPSVPDVVAEVPTETGRSHGPGWLGAPGYLVGWSAGAAVAAALEIVRAGARCLCGGGRL